MTNYEKYFGSPMGVALTIYKECGGDCYACLMPHDAPCYGKFYVSSTTALALYSWLMREAKE